MSTRRFFAHSEPDSHDNYREASPGTAWLKHQGTRDAVLLGISSTNSRSNM